MTVVCGMMAARRALALCSLLAATACEPARAQADDAEAALRAGRYDEAIAAFTRAAAADTAVRARKGLLRALREVGRYAEGEEAGRRFVASPHPRAHELWNSLGEHLALRGKVSEAEDAFQKAIRARAADSLRAEANLAASLYARGERDRALRTFDRFIDIYNTRRPSAGELVAIAIACRYLGRNDPQLFKDAVRAFDEAAAADTMNLEPRVLLGELFLEKYNAAEASEAFAEVLRINPSHPRALLGRARVLAFDGQPGALEPARKSLEVNPSLVEAHAFVATLRLLSEDYRGAARDAERALAVNPVSSEALAVLAAIRYLQGDRGGFEDARRRALARNAADAELYATLADLAARNRLYREAADFARQGVALDPKSWRALGLLGMNQLRLGQMEEGRRNLETAFAADPYDVWTKNTLDLLDTFAEYRETRTPRFLLVIDGSESELLSLYAGELAEEAFDRLAERYAYRPPTPLRVELFRSHADFSVRTVGLAGLGALGVSFGPVLAMDAPSAREAGQFNWGSTLWHELAHTFTLGMTENRVPRWLSEGLSVLEERRARAGWGAHVTPGFLIAYKRGRLLPVSRLNDGFMRPGYPEQIIFSYYQASLLCEMIEREWGPRAMVAILEGYRSGQGTEQLVRRVLGTDLEGVDRKFDAFMQERFGVPLAALRVEGDGAAEESAAAPRATRSEPDAGDFLGQLGRGRALFADGKLEAAVPYLERAKALFPQYVEGDSPYWLLAQIHGANGRRREAAAELATLTGMSETNYAANVRLAALLDTLGDHAGAAAALERALYIHPYEAAVHDRLANLYARLGDHRRAVRERRAIVALAPVDRAEAFYQLALAYSRAGDAGAARREVLRALEVAPGFEKAQELLLQLRTGAGGGA